MCNYKGLLRRPTSLMSDEIGIVNGNAKQQENMQKNYLVMFLLACVCLILKYISETDDSMMTRQYHFDRFFLMLFIRIVYVKISTHLEFSHTANFKIDNETMSNIKWWIEPY